MPTRKVSGIWYLVSGIRNTKYKILNTKYRKAFGFTLIELLIVISIIAILVAAASASWTNAQQKSRDGKRKSDLKGIQQALELYFQQNNQYPLSTTTSGKIRCPNGSTIDWGKEFTCDGSTTSYMNPLPKDPVNSGGFIYKYDSCVLGASGNPLKYQIEAQLENTKDP